MSAASGPAARPPSCSSSPARAASARPRIAAVARRCSPRAQGKRTLVCEVDAKGDLADVFECGPLAFEPREVQPDLFAMAMNTEDSLKEYLEPPAAGPAAGPHRPAGPHLRLRGQRRAGREGDPHRRQARLGGAGAPLRPRRGRRRRRPVTSSASSPPARPSTSSCRSGWSATRPAGCSTSSATRPAPASSS